MRNFIKSNYNIYPKKIYKKDDKYFFFSNNEKIFILKTFKDEKYLNKIIDLSNNVYKAKINISTFLLNVKGKFYTKKDNYYILLLKYNDDSYNEITLDDININKTISNLQIDNYNLINSFENEIDELEKEITEYNKEFSIIQKSIDYFIGLSENGIQLLKTINLKEECLCHNIDIEKYNKYEFNNPFNLIKTNKMYDYANYFKYKFYNKTIDYEELYKLIINNNKEDLICFFSCMLYQKEYFTCVKDILSNIKEEKELSKYINEINNYKELIIYIKNTMNHISEIQQIEWID
ncbi:MAG: hypothetical protein IJK67_05090 [Bacilli bacterium]|nr:hypothetical protein [Bacilli bacterium]